MNDQWVQLCHLAGIALSSKQADLLSRYIDLLLDANQRMNLTRIDTREEQKFCTSATR